MTHSTFTASDGVRIAYCVEDYTDPWRPADTLLMLHSAMGSARRFYSMVPGLGRRYRVVRPDMRGHGASQVPPETLPLTSERLTEDVLELLAVLKLDKVHVVGNSAGGYIAQRLAIRHPQRVKSIALFGATPGLRHTNAASWLPQVEKKGLRAFLAETISDRFPVKEVDPRLIEWFLDEAAKTDAAYIRRFIGYWSGVDFMDEIHRIGCPVLIVAPGAEPIGRTDTYSEMHKRIAGSELIFYEDARHNICDYLPDRCVADILAFLERRFGAHA